MNSADAETDQLLNSIADGDRTAVDRLLARHRDRLKRMVTMRIDRRLRARFDPSDVVQEALVQAAERLSQFARERPMPFYPWVRNIAFEQLVKMHEKHAGAAKRTVDREQRFGPALSNESVRELANRLATSATGPADKLIQKEIRRRVRAALELISIRDREILELRYLEQLDNLEIAAILDVTPGAVRTRHFRALQRLHHLLSDDSIGSQP